MLTKFPSQQQLSLPVLNALSEAGGQASAKEAADRVAATIGLAPEVRDATRLATSGCVNLWDRHVRWVRQKLVDRGLIGDDKFNVWTLTEDGEGLLRNAKPGVVVTVFETDHGIALWAEAEAAASVIEDGSVQCVVTSPPYCLLRKKDYANQHASRDHVAWLSRFFATVMGKLTVDGSIFLNVSDTWEAGQPTMDPWTDRLLISLIDDCGYHLAQKLYWHNPSKMPSPAQWVTVNRVRVTPAVEEVFWLSKNPHPFADNRQVLRPYSDSMRQLIERGGQKAAARPSGYSMRDDAFGRDNGGSIAHSLLSSANTSSNDEYQRFVKTSGLVSHPARFPSALPEFSIKLASRPGDLVWDPFGGSFTTAAVAEKLGRRWISNEKSLTYALGGQGRFPTARSLISQEQLAERIPGSGPQSGYLF